MMYGFMPWQKQGNDIYKNTHREGMWICAAVVCALIGAVILAVSMKLGPGIGGDATIYITSARNLLAGNGLGLVNAAGEFRLIPYFPPFYSLVLAFCGLLSFDLTTASLVLNLLFFAGLIYLVTIRTLRITERLFPAVTFGLLLAGSPILIPAYSWAMSEPLAILTGFAGFILLERFFSTEDKKAFGASAVLLGLSFLTRYSSAAFIGAAVILLFCFSAETWKKRFSNAFFYGLVSVIPMIVWLVIDYTRTSTVASRSVLSGQTAALWAAFLPKIKYVFTLWLLPESLTATMPSFLVSLISLFFVLFPLGILIASGLSIKNGSDHPEFSGWFFLLSAFILLYDLLIVFVSLNTYPPITINTRMLLPVYIAEFWLVTLIFGLFSVYSDRPAITFTFNTALFIFALYCCLRGVRIARQNAIDGLGYNSAVWQSSETVEYIRENISEEKTIVTNEETALLYLLNRRTWPMHEVYVNEPDANYYAYESGEDLGTDGSRQIFREGGAYLVVFDTFEHQMVDIYGDQTLERIGKLFENLNVLFHGDDGTIYTLERED